MVVAAFAMTRVHFSFHERMVGPMARGVDNPRVGAERGRAEGTWFAGDFAVTIDDLAACIDAPDHPARLGGRVSFGDLAHEAVVTEGSLHLYVEDRETGMKQLRYRLGFRGRDGAGYRLDATKFIRPGRATIREQVTAYARLFRTPDVSPKSQLVGAAGIAPGREEETAAASVEQVVAAGVLVFRMRDLPAFLWSMRVMGDSRMAGLRLFLGFVRRELRTPVPVLAT